MKELRMLGNMVRKLSNEQRISTTELSEILNCTNDRVYDLFTGRLLPSYEQLEVLAKALGIKVSDLLNGDENYYNKTVVHCVGEFSDVNNREEILDIIDDFLDIQKAIAQ